MTIVLTFLDEFFLHCFVIVRTLLLTCSPAPLMANLALAKVEIRQAQVPSEYVEVTTTLLSKACL